jgi:hypothetical protein
MVYGSVFLVGWNFDFPTVLEMWLWRASSLVLVSYGTLVSLTLIIKIPFISTSFIAKIRTQQHQARRKVGVSNATKYLLLAIISVTWGFARWYIAVESVISLRKVPAGTYETVDWTNRIPHIT